MIKRQDIISRHEENINNIQCELLEYRCYGDDKLKKPKVLKGLKAIKSFDLIGNKVNVFDLGNGDLVLYFGTLFSKEKTFSDKEDMSLPAPVLAAKYGWNKRGFKSFIYPDAWCTIYNRNEGYILVKGLKTCFDELYCINVASISEKLYSCIRSLSLKDSRFFMLRLVPTDVESANYSRLCEDIVTWLYIEKRNEVEFNKV